MFCQKISEEYNPPPPHLPVFLSNLILINNKTVSRHISFDQSWTGVYITVKNCAIGSFISRHPVCTDFLRHENSHCIIFVFLIQRKLQSIKHDKRFVFWKNFEDISIRLHRVCYLNMYEHRTHVSFIKSLYCLQVRDWESGFSQAVNAFKVLLNMMLLNNQTMKQNVLKN